MWFIFDQEQFNTMRFSENYLTGLESLLFYKYSLSIMNKQLGNLIKLLSCEQIEEVIRFTMICTFFLCFCVCKHDMCSN